MSSSRKQNIDQQTQSTVGQVISKIQRLAETGSLPTIEPILPLLLNLQGKPYTLQDQFHFASLFRLRRPQRIVYKCGRQVGKCRVVSDVPDVKLHQGRYVRIGEVKEGDLVSCIQDNFEATAGRVAKIHRTGTQTCYRVKTRMGSVLEITCEHKIRTLSGYTALADLQIGSRICSPRQAGEFTGAVRYKRSRIISTALMLGDGSCGTGDNQSLCFVSQTKELIELLKTLSLRHTREIDRENGTKELRFSRKSILRKWFEEDQIWGKYSYEKSIPSWVFDLNKQQTQLFISYLYATDGSLKGSQTIEYYSTSNLMARQVRSLLCKFGIPSSISCKKAGYTDDDGKYHECRDVWTVRVETRAGLQTFFDNFDVPGKPAFNLSTLTENNNRDTLPQDEIQHLIDKCARGLSYKHSTSFRSSGLRQKLKYPPQRKKITKYIEHFRKHNLDSTTLEEFERACTDDVIWDEIVSIECIGEHETIDLEIETHHNYDIDGIITHNSTTFSADSVITSAMIPHFSTLHVTPLFEQIRRFSTMSVRPFIHESPLRDYWINTSTESSVLQRTFRNGSRMLFSFALADADRTRGLSCKKVVIDEAQDFDRSLIPVILEVLAADRDYALEQYSGTPKTFDGTLEYYWQKSSQAEWWIPCQHCTTNGKPTYNIPAANYHIEDMIGPMRDDISPELPAIICYKCNKPLYSRFGHWEHRYPERRWDFAGYHIPQIIIPLHYDNRKKWAMLLQKRNSVDTATFYNEVLGESRDEGQKLVSLTELQAACRLPYTNSPKNPPKELMDRLDEYKTRVLAIDWGGGGEAGLSLTVMALVCFKPDGGIDVPWATKGYGVDHMAEAAEAVKWFNHFQCHMLAHDYTGAGVLRETLLIQAGLPLSRDMPIQYVRSSHQDLLIKVPASHTHRRDHWRVDKTRSLHYTIAAIRTGKLSFFKYDNISSEDPGLVEHFLRLIENRTKIESAGSVYRVISNGLGPDDFAQAVNLGCICSWEINDAYPNFAEAAHIKLDPSLLPLVGDYNQQWDASDVEQGFDRDYFG